MTQPTDPQADGVYAAEDAAAAQVPLRRFSRFAHIESYVTGVTLSEWWSERFPPAPIEIVVLRRSRGATFSAAACTDDDVGVIALVDGKGWRLETVLHELAHLAAGRTAGHGAPFRVALAELWRHEAGFEAWAALCAELDRAGFRNSAGLRNRDGRPGDEPPVVFPRPGPHP